MGTDGSEAVETLPDPCSCKTGEYHHPDLCCRCYSIAVGGGFGSYLLGLNMRTYEQAGVDTEGNTPGSTKELAIGWMTGFLFVTSFVGLLTLVPIRKIMIIDYKLTYPSGTATAVLINGFHTPKGDVMAKKQVHGFVKFFSASFVWAFFQWFYTGGDSCGFVQFLLLDCKHGETHH